MNDLYYVISYDLIDKKDYAKIETVIKSYTYFKALETVRLIKSTLSASQLLEKLVWATDNDDKIIVAEFNTGNFDYTENIKT